MSQYISNPSAKPQANRPTLMERQASIQREIDARREEELRAMHGGMDVDADIDPNAMFGSKLTKKIQKLGLHETAEGKRKAEELDDFVEKAEKSLPKHLMIMPQDDPAVKDLYEPFLYMDKDKKFSLEPVFGTTPELAYRGTDRPKFYYNTAKKRADWKPADNKRAAIQVRGEPSLADRTFGWVSKDHEYNDGRKEAERVKKEKQEAEEKQKQLDAEAEKEKKKGKKDKDTPDEEFPALTKEPTPEDPDAAMEDIDKLFVDEIDWDADERDQIAYEDLVDPRFLNVKFLCDTQRPSIQLIIQMPEGKKVFCNIFAKSIQSPDDSTIGLEFTHAGEVPRCKHPLPHDSLVRTAAADKKLFRTDLDLYATDQDANGKDTGYVYRPVFGGISEVAIVGLCKRYNANKDDHGLSDQELLIVMLYSRYEFSIFIVEYEDRAPAIHDFAKFFCGVVYACIKTGYFWWYARAAYVQVEADNKKEKNHEEGVARKTFEMCDITHPEYPFWGVPYPRWLENEWLVKYKGEMAMSSKCLTVATFHTNSAIPGPDGDATAFESRLAVARNDEKLRDGLVRLQDRDQTTLLARFIVDQDGGVFVAMNISAVANDGHKAERPPIPPVGTSAEIAYTAEGGKLTSIKGVFTEDLFETKRDMFLIGTKAQGKDMPQENNGDTLVGLKINTSNLSQMRAFNAVQTIHQARPMLLGPDMSALVLGTVSRRTTDVSWVHDRMNEFGRVRGKAFEEVINKASLNTSQKQAALDCFKPGSGVFFVWGPAGTGKSYLMGQIVFAAVKAGFKVMVTAPSNTAVDVIMDAFAKVYDGDELDWVRFLSASVKPVTDGKKAADGAKATPFTPVGSEDTAFLNGDPTAIANYKRTVFMHAMIDANRKDTNRSKDNSLSIKKVLWARKQAELSSDPRIQNQCRDYVRILDKLLAGETRGPGKVGKEDREWFKSNDPNITELYLNACNVVFVTDNTSAHEGLLGFLADILVMDEAALASPPDSAVALASNRPKAVLMSGDHRQMGPRHASRGVNESADCLGTSIFKRFMSMEKEVRPGNHVMLDTQYRMHPQLSKFVADSYYEGNLMDAPATSVDSPFIQQWNARTKGLVDMGLLNGRRRICVDVDAFSEVEENGTSCFNMAEAVAIASFVHEFITVYKIDPKNILGLTPYHAQARKIKEQIRKYNHGDVRIMTTGSAQGQEGQIVLCSLVQHVENYPDKLGHIVEPELHLVNISRARELLIVFGPFAALRQMIVNETKKNGKGQEFRFFKKEYSIFRQWIEDCLAKGDCVLWHDWTDHGNNAVLPPPGAFDRSSWWWNRPIPKEAPTMENGVNAGNITGKRDAKRIKEAPDAAALETGRKAELAALNKQAAKSSRGVAEFDKEYPEPTGASTKPKPKPNFGRGNVGNGKRSGGKNFR